MDSKNLLILLVAIFVYINVYEPLVIKNKRDTTKLFTYTKKLSSEQKFILHKNEIVDFITKSKAVLENNEKALYDTSIQNSIIFNQMQSQIKNLVRLNNAKLINVLWGEPYSEENSSYINIPFTFIIEIEPAKLYDLFTKLFAHSKSITIKQLFIVKKKNILVVNMQIYLHKNKQDTAS